MSTPQPIEIVGGGLAGLSLALALQRGGTPVTLIEAGVYPRHRVCGEFIAGLDSATMERLGLAPLLADAQRHRTVTWFHGERAVRSQNLPEPALGLSRHALDARLAAAFTAAGGTLRTGIRGEQDERPGRVLSAGRRPEKDSEWIGLKAHVRGLALQSGLELHLGTRAYVGLCAVEDGWVNVCGLFHRSSLGGSGRLEALSGALRASGLAPLAERLAQAEIDPESCCAVAGLAFGRQRGPAATFALGDRHALIPPFTGNGMAMALQDAAHASDLLLAWSRGHTTWTHAAEEHRRRQRSATATRLATARCLHPFLITPRGPGWLAAAARFLPLGPLYHLTH